MTVASEVTWKSYGDSRRLIALYSDLELVDRGVLLSTLSKSWNDLDLQQFKPFHHIFSMRSQVKGVLGNVSPVIVQIPWHFYLGHDTLPSSFVKHRHQISPCTNPS